MVTFSADKANKAGCAGLRAAGRGGRRRAGARLARRGAPIRPAPPVRRRGAPTRGAHSCSAGGAGLAPARGRSDSKPRGTPVGFSLLRWGWLLQSNPCGSGASGVTAVLRLTVTATHLAPSPMGNLRPQHCEHFRMGRCSQCALATLWVWLWLASVLFVVASIFCQPVIAVEYYQTVQYSLT